MGEKIRSRAGLANQAQSMVFSETIVNAQNAPIPSKS